MKIITETMKPYYLTLLGGVIAALAIWGSICYSVEFIY